MRIYYLPFLMLLAFSCNKTETVESKIAYPEFVLVGDNLLLKDQLLHPGTDHTMAVKLQGDAELEVVLKVLDGQKWRVVNHSVFNWMNDDFISLSKSQNFYTAGDSCVISLELYAGTYKLLCTEKLDEEYEWSKVFEIK